MTDVTGMAQPGPDAFRAHVGSDFAIDCRGTTILLRLAEVVDHGTANGTQQYALLFHGPAAPVLPDAIYAVEHRVLGTIEIFIAPIVGSNAARIVYQACFSRPA